jgi:hypothetical protein
MIKWITIFAVATGLAGCAGGINTTPASQVQPTGPYARPGLPQSQYECMMDEGNGRSSSCGAAI